VSSLIFRKHYPTHIKWCKIEDILTRRNLPMAEMVRLTTRINTQLNEWFDERSKETGIPKSTLIFMALDTHVQQQKAMESMRDINKLQLLMDEMDNLKKELQGNK
jgi:hypothetical protein